MPTAAKRSTLILTVALGACSGSSAKLPDAHPPPAPTVTSPTTFVIGGERPRYDLPGKRLVPTTGPAGKRQLQVVTLATGGSAGKEGPIAQIGAGVGSYLATRLGLSARDRRILLLAGTAGALATKGMFDFLWPHLSQALPWGVTLVLGIIVAAAAIAGDLIESLLKRDAQVKDAGKLLPGMGGVLDRIDSFLLGIPVLYYLLLFYVFLRVG